MCHTGQTGAAVSISALFVVIVADNSLRELLAEATALVFSSTLSFSLIRSIAKTTVARVSAHH